MLLLRKILFYVFAVAYLLTCPDGDYPMPRRLRDLVDGGCYHLIARGNNRRFIFDTPAAFRQFQAGLARAKKIGGVPPGVSSPLDPDILTRSRITK